MASSRTITSFARTVSRELRASSVRSSWVWTIWPIWCSLASSPSRRCSKVVSTRPPELRRRWWEKVSVRPGHRTLGGHLPETSRWPVGERPGNVVDERYEYARSGCRHRLAVERSCSDREQVPGGGVMPKVLVVDDEESLLEAVRYALSREGFDVSVARDGGAAVRVFEAERPDLLVLDLMLP